MSLELVLSLISIAFFAWFFEFSIKEVPYLKWYGNFLDKLNPDVADVLGRCPYCFAPWVFLFITYASIPEVIVGFIYATGWIYAANCFFSKYLD